MDGIYWPAVGLGVAAAALLAGLVLLIVLTRRVVWEIYDELAGVFRDYDGDC